MLSVAIKVGYVPLADMLVSEFGGLLCWAGLAPAPFTLFLEYVDLAAWLIEGDGNVDYLDYRDRLHRWCFG